MGYRERADAWLQRHEQGRFGYVIAMLHRFFAIDGVDMAGLLVIEYFSVIIPIFVLLAAFASSFDAQNTADLVPRLLGLRGTGALEMAREFRHLSELGGRLTWATALSFGAWGIPTAIQVAKLFSLAWNRKRARFHVEVIRGTVWFLVYVAIEAALLGLTINRAELPPGIRQIALFLAPSFLLWFLTPVIILPGQIGGLRGALRSGLAGMVIDGVILRSLIRFVIPPILHSWRGWGPVGLAMTLMTISIMVATAWTIAACAGAVLYERFTLGEIQEHPEGPLTERFEQLPAVEEQLAAAEDSLSEAEENLAEAEQHLAEAEEVLGDPAGPGV